MQHAGDQKSGGVAEPLDDVAYDQTVQHGSVGADAAHEAGDRAYYPGGEHVGCQGLHDRRPELMSEHGHAEKYDRHMQRSIGDEE